MQMSSRAIVGGDILRLVTAGMYGDPLVLYREYLQNAADSVASFAGKGGSVIIKLDPLEGQISITDDGAGLSPRDAARRLIAIGNSPKNPAVDRGVHGIGRLSALAFAQNVHFTTRTCASEAVTQVSWNGRALRDPELERVGAATAIKACTNIRSLGGDGWPDRFFQVTVEGVSRYAASTLLNQDMVRNYIGEVCPVPIASSFPFAKDIKDFLSEHTDYFTLNVCLDRADEPIERPFHETIPLTDSYSAPFERLEKRVIPQLDEGAPAAVLWLAHTSYAGSIPPRLGVRGLRARAGNIQVGSDDVFSHLFLETRFSGWCVGEVHIVDSRIIPNARRDYFEPGPHLRNLENHIGAMAQEISARCRSASSHRNRLKNLGVAINQVKCAQDIAKSGYLLAADATALLDGARERISQIQQTLDELKITPSQVGFDELSLCPDELESKEPSKSLGLDSLPSEVVAALQSAFGAVADTMPPDAALDVIESMIHRLAGGSGPQEP